MAIMARTFLNHRLELAFHYLPIVIRHGNLSSCFQADPAAWPNQF